MGTIDFGFQGLKNNEGNLGRGGASNLIRSAEKLAASGRYDFAIEQLSVAQRLDPGNRYIQAIMDRIRVAQNPSNSENSLLNTAEQSSMLSITVGRQFKDGIRSSEDEPNISPEELHTKIRFLTNMADQYMESGSSDKAFDALMKAYLLDPLSPYVIASEKSVLPAWERNRSKPNQKPVASTRELSDTINIGHMSMASSNPSGIPSPLTPRPTQSAGQPQEEQARLDALRQQKEQERLERERTVWREASKPPRIFGEDDPMSVSSQQQPPEQVKPQSMGLFSKLRLGKFLE